MVRALSSVGSAVRSGSEHSSAVPLQTFTNDDNDKFTMLRVELPDRPGLLTDLVQTLRCVTWLVLLLLPLG